MGIRTSLRTVVSVAGLAVRAPGWLVNWNRSRARAKRTFHRELVSSGIPPDEARTLTELYPFEMGDMVAVARNLNKQPTDPSFQ